MRHQTVAIGYQDFSAIRERDYFYIDKTDFIQKWWDNGDQVTLITRPRRFGKTLTLSMVETFFSIDYAKRPELFEGLEIQKHKKFRELRGTYPVINISFANVKETTYEAAKARISQMLVNVYSKYNLLLKNADLSDPEKEYCNHVTIHMDETAATGALHQLSFYLSRYYEKKVIILLDEYDTPMQEAYMHGYWREMAAFMRSLFNSTLKTNPYLERALLTGITRIGKESIFSDLNNLEVITVTSDAYAEEFGFTEEEVFQALEDYGMSEKKTKVKDWYDGFTFGTHRGIYNPWSIINFLDKKKLGAYWANTSSNSLIGTLIREGDPEIKSLTERLLNGETITTEIDEQIVFHQLHERKTAIWSLMLACGYMKVEQYYLDEDTGEEIYKLKLTNHEVYVMLRRIIKDWFSDYSPAYNDFIKALLLDDKRAMNRYMNEVAMETFSFFDTGKRPSGKSEPERFYHGFVLGLLVDLADRYVVTSNRESGFGRYDVLLEPKSDKDDAIIIEFKVRDNECEENLSDTVASALVQIEEKGYARGFRAKGIAEGRIRRYGFAFEGKTVLIG